MKYKLRPYLSFVLPFILIISVNAQKKEVTFHDYQDRIETLLRQYKVPAAGIGIIEDWKLRQILVFGNIRKEEPAPFNSIFQVASLTKPVTAMLTLKLVSIGEWDLDEPLSHYWVDPDVITDPRHLLLTTRYVLSHQTGFDNWRWNNKSKKLIFNFTPGTKFKYSGEGFEYLKHALESKFKMPLDKLADSLLFRPLQMNDTRYTWDDKIDLQRYAVPHDTSGAELEIPKNIKPSAADFLKTSVEDYSKFGVAVMTGSGLTAAVFNEMIKPQAKVSNYESFGLGWDIIPNLSNGEYALLHTGSDPGTRTAVILLPESGRGLVIFTNGDNGNDLIQHIVLQYLDLGKEILEKLENN